jgi:site-specific recombinase
MRSHPAPDRPALEQLFSTLRMTIMKFTTIYLHLCASSATQPSHQASALAPTMDHGGHRDVSHARKPQITSLLTDWLPY